MKMKVILFVSFLFLGIGVSLYAQVNNEDVLLTIAGKDISVSEFMSIYQKNNPKGGFVDKKNLDEYLDLYINFKLKVKQAEDLGLDTLSSFKNELKGYRDQLAKPYMVDETEIDKLVREAFEREHFDVRASHIFFKMAPEALPKDTAEAFEKLSKIRDRIMKGEDFGKLAAEFSEDPSARDREANQQHPFLPGNHGDLGYFTVFDFVYPFETGVYTTAVGNISPIVRTNYGYHLIKTTDRRKAMGKVTVAHIYMMIPKEATSADSARVKMRIDSVYRKLRMGAKWDTLVNQYSDDKGSASKGGVLPKFGVNKLVPEFIQVVYNLENNGDYSAPFLTSYGWHIVKLIERQTPGSFDEEKAELKKKVTNDGRMEIARQAVYARVKQEYGFTEYPGAKSEFYKVVTDSIFVGKWDKSLAKNLTNPLFKIGDQVVNQQNFAQYLADTQRKKEKTNVEVYVNQTYTSFVNDNLMKWENAHLEQKYPDFRNLMTEYRDGILLFNLTDEKVWSKAVKDTTGLKEFYEKNKNNYKWDTRLNATIFTLKDPKLAQKVKNFIKSGLSDEDIMKEVNTDSLKVLTVESGKFSRKDNRFIDSIAWVPGISKEFKNDSISSTIVFVNVRQVLKPEIKNLNEARGLITADYQNYLEKLWIQYLRQKYPVVIHKDILAKIK
jgi:peptidyl-prolyl cis-trans isomerase SurA